jgi:hypothetical protein
MIVLGANPTALQRRLPTGWQLAPYSGDDLRGSSLRGANLLVPFHEVYAVRSQDHQVIGLPQLSYVPFVSQAREQATGELAHVHWLTYTEDPAGVPDKYADGVLAQITRSQTFSKERRGETRVLLVPADDVRVPRHSPAGAGEGSTSGHGAKEETVSTDATDDQER